MKIKFLNPKKGKSKMARKRATRKKRTTRRKRARRNPSTKVIVMAPTRRKASRKRYKRPVSKRRRSYRRNPERLTIRKILNNIQPLLFGGLGGIAGGYVFNMIPLPATWPTWAKPAIKLGVAGALPVLIKGRVGKALSIGLGIGAAIELVTPYLPENLQPGNEMLGANMISFAGAGYPQLLGANQVSFNNDSGFVAGEDFASDYGAYM